MSMHLKGITETQELPQTPVRIDSELSKSLICFLTKKIFYDPVIASDGYTYEKEAIQQRFIQGNVASPYTGKKMKDLELFPNFIVKSQLHSGILEDNFNCPITLEEFITPVMTSDGYSYEETEITRWFHSRENSPMTGVQMKVKKIIFVAISSIDS